MIGMEFHRIYLYFFDQRKVLEKNPVTSTNLKNPYHEGGEYAKKKNKKMLQERKYYNKASK